MQPLLQVEKLVGGYTNKNVLHTISFHVNEAEIVGLIGLNGAGKSTTIKHILGLMEPEKGSVKICGKTFQEDKNEYRRSLAFIPETPILYDELTLWEHLDLTALAYGLDEPTFLKRVDELLREFRMEKMRSWYPSHFSKGMRQKVMIMSAFLIEPLAYVVDEPIVGLDP